MLSSLLDKTATLESFTAGQDAGGGTTKTFSALTSNVKCAVWPKGSSLARTFGRDDILGTHIIATDQDCGAKAGYRFRIGSTYYLVEGVEPYSNAAITGEQLWIHDVSLRTV